MASRKQPLVDSKGADELEKIASIDRQLVELLDRRARLVSDAMDSSVDSKMRQDRCSIYGSGRIMWSVRQSRCLQIHPYLNRS